MRASAPGHATRLREKAAATLEAADSGGVEYATLMQGEAQIQALLSISFQLAALTDAVYSLDTGGRR